MSRRSMKQIPESADRDGFRKRSRRCKWRRKALQRLQPKIDLKGDDWTRWNDYGIGFFLQGDLKGARAAFEKITQIDANNVDGWVNLGRVAVQEGDMERARVVLEKALALQPKLARAELFLCSRSSQ